MIPKGWELLREMSGNGIDVRAHIKNPSESGEEKKRRALQSILRSDQERIDRICSNRPKAVEQGSEIPGLTLWGYQFD